MEYDFGGYLTKYNVKCTDGLTIGNNAFAHQDGEKIPFVFQHMRNEPKNIIGSLTLEHRENDGLYAWASLNNSAAAQDCVELVQHEDVDSFSIYARGCTTTSTGVVEHGTAHEGSLVLRGANPEAKIDYITFQHSDGSSYKADDEFIMHSTESIEFEHAEDDTIEDILESMSEEQYDVMTYMVDQAVKLAKSDKTAEQADNKEGVIQHMNIFDQKARAEAKKTNPNIPIFNKKDFDTILEHADKTGSYKQAVIEHAATYGIDNIEVFFPDAKTLSNTPDMVSREMAWVNAFLSGTRKAPFARIKTLYVDITANEARAKGYVKGKQKVEEVIKAAKRTTEPTWIYKKQKFDREDIINVTDWDVIMFIKQEMRLMLNEELARASLIGDGRAIDDDDKINEDCIRPVWTDEEFYSYKYTLTSNDTLKKMDDIVKARKFYKGSGKPILFTTVDEVTDMILLKNTQNERMFKTMDEIKAALMVSDIVEVEVMENQTREVGSNTHALKGILMNPADYTHGTDKGGEVSFFDHFDIDVNQYKYLYETYLSGSLRKWRSAIVFETVTATPTPPAGG